MRTYQIIIKLSHPDFPPSKHMVRTTENVCGLTNIAAYFQTGQMPGNGSVTFCALEAGPFGIALNGTLEENIIQAGLSDLVH